MGADQIGYITFIPTSKDVAKLVKKRVAEFNKLFEKFGEEALEAEVERVGKDDKLTAEQVTEKAQEIIADKIVAGLESLGVDTKYLADYKSYETNDELVENVKEAVEKLEGFDPNKLDYRDVCSRRDKINGVEVLLVFAGGGYTVLQALEMVGLLGKLEDMIPGLNNGRRK
jgi:hypothetical protein